MKVAYSILKRFLPDLNDPVEKIAEILTSQGFVIESIIPASEIFSSNLTVATLVKRKTGILHDVCTVQMKERQYEIKCEKWGIPGIGKKVIMNLIGDSTSTQPLRNQRIPEKEEFFIELPAHIKAEEGELISPHIIGEDWVLDVEITANRGDCMSIIGLVREIAAGLDLEYQIPSHHFDVEDMISNFQVRIDDQDLCPLYSGRLAINFKIQPSPWWIVHELYLLGQRPINQVVDVTNLVMMETGQPLHAFNASAISDQKIVVRRAKKNESFITLDGIERKLTNTMLVIADAKRSVAIAGIMGGYESEVSPDTHEIFLEAAIFSGSQIRKTARELGLRTEASARFERGVDPGSVFYASQRALYLLKEIDPSIKILKDWVMSGEGVASEPEIEFASSWVEEIMNCHIPLEKMQKALTKLGFILLSQPNNPMVKVKVPSWRPDVQQPIDCAEEVGRIFGYHHIKSQIPSFPYDPGNPRKEFLWENVIRHYLRSKGLKECVSLSLTSQTNCDLLGIPETDLIRVLNPLSQDHVVLRPNLIISALDILKTNIARGRENFGFFEFGEVFSQAKDPVDNPYCEEWQLVIVLSGYSYPSYWQHLSQVDIFSLKGLAESLIELTGYPIQKVQWQSIGENPYFDPNLSFCGILDTGALVLRGGLIQKSICDAFSFWGEHYCLEVAWQKLLDQIKMNDFQLQETNRFPSIRRDISIVVNHDQTWKNIEGLVLKVASSHHIPMERVEIFDSYQGEHLPPGKKTFSYSIVFRSLQKTLTDNEVDEWVKIIKEAIKKEPEILLREELTGGF
ncbi:MAG: phenylalanine--tRNA ligase subunit beta [Candidatus Atribacteria bacterium]|nr:phenylalanine--tRNA ligase subunit beta [Candidatus Atribacteria bacterium]